MDFPCVEKENFLLQHCSPCHDTYVCTIWAHYHKLCPDSSHNIGRLARKPRNLEHDRSFCEGFFETYSIYPAWYFSLQICHIIRHHAKDLRWSDRFLFFYARFKLWSKRRAWRFLARGRASLNLHWISKETWYYESKNDFYQKSWASDHVPVVQTGPTSCRFGRNLSFSPGVNGKVWDTPVGTLSM